MTRPTKIQNRHNHTNVTIGSIFDQWLVKKAPILHGKHYKAECKCSCGKLKLVKTHNLLKGKSKSCGCIQRLKLSSFSKGKPSVNSVSVSHLAITQLINSYKHSAKKRKLIYSLSRDEFESLIFQKCFYCQKDVSNTKIVKKTPFKYNGIDRFNNLIGYEISNCRPCCATCNVMKLDMSGEDFLEHISNITKNNKIINTFSLKKMDAYHARAIAVASQSHDIHTKVGAILINSKTLAVMAEGYNGFVRGAPDSKLPITRPEKYDYIVHAETNLLCNAVRSGVQTDEAIIYCTLSPCVKCLRVMWQAGVSTFYFKEKYKDFDQCTSMLDLEATIEYTEPYYKMKIKPRS